MRLEYDGYELDDSLDRIDFERVHSWLVSSYWCPGEPRERVEKAAANSTLVVGAYLDGVQVGYLRIVSDRTTFGWVSDVFVDEAARGRGIAKAMVRFAQAHPDHQGFRRWVLATRDAHQVYLDTGFVPIPSPDPWMIYVPDPSAQPNIE